MANMKSNIFKFAKAVAPYVLMVIAVPAFAQSGGTSAGLCYLVNFIKGLIGVVAVLAILLYVINSFFGKSALIGEIIEKVLIGCTVAVAAVFLVTSTSLTVSCSVI